LPCKQIFQEQHYFEPNRPCSLFVREWKLSSGRDEQISSQGVLPYNNEPMYSKANEDSDKIDHTSQEFVYHNIPIRVKSYSRQLFSPHVQNTKLMNNNMVQREMS
jgi:E1A/CREB-binding protein